MPESHATSKRVRWATSAVGTKPRFLFMCGSSVFLGVGSIVGVTLLVKVVGIRATHDLPVMPLERGLFALVCASILVARSFTPSYPLLRFVGCFTR